MSIAQNIALVRGRIDAAAIRAARNPRDITLMAVTKTVDTGQIRDAYQAGICVFGENRVQEFGGKIRDLNELPGAEWHMIGHLQTNKTSQAAQLFSYVD